MTILFEDLKPEHLTSLSRHIFIIILFGIFYYTIYTNIDNSFDYKKEYGDLTFTDFLYFSLVTQTTVGYGDITPIHRLARIGCMAQLLTTYAVVIISII